MFRREAEATPKKRKLEEGEEVTTMFCPFVRGHYGDGQDIPKVGGWVLACGAPEEKEKKTIHYWQIFYITTLL